MTSDAPESSPSLAGRLRRVGEMLIGLSGGSPVRTHLFQTLAAQAQAVVPHDYLAVCLEDVEQHGHLVHSLTGLAGEAVAGRVFGKDEGLPGHTIRTGRAYLVAELDTIPDAAPDPADPQPSAFTSANTWPAAIIASRMMGTPT